MDQLGDELKRMLKAGLGAVATGAEKAQEAIETLAQKGEPLYQQAKSAVTDAADKIRQAVNDSGIRDAMSGKPNVQDVIDDLRAMTREDLALVRAALDEFEALADRAAEEAAQDGAGDAAATEEAPTEHAPDAPADEKTDSPE